MTPRAATKRARTGPTLRLSLLNIYREPLAENVDIILRNLRLTGTRIAKNVDTSGEAVITGLEPFPNGLYKVEIDPPSYLPVANFVNLGASGETFHEIVLPIDPVKVVGLKAATFADLGKHAQDMLDASSSVLGFDGLSGKALYEALDDIRRAGFLNILCKIENTVLPNGLAVITYFKHLLELRGDRLFVAVPHELREDVKNALGSDLFEKADDTMHHPPVGFTRAGSFKTKDHYGNLQLSFFSDGSEWLVDVDIDDARGLEHVFQVLRNHLTGQPTHPYAIHQILVHHQNLRPLYRLRV